MDKPIHIQLVEEPRPRQDVAEIGLDGSEMLSLLSMFDRYGAWRLDIETGLTYWTPDVYAIHGLPWAPGPVNLADAIRAYHPDDRAEVAAIVEEAITRRGGFRFVLRLSDGRGGFRLVKSVGRWHSDGEGRESLIGLFSEFGPAQRTVALAG